MQQLPIPVLVRVFAIVPLLSCPCCCFRYFHVGWIICIPPLFIKQEERYAECEILFAQLARLQPESSRKVSDLKAI